MKKEILFEAIGEIDDDLIENSETLPKKKGRLIPFAVAAAACLVLICVGAFRLGDLGMLADFTSAETAPRPEGAIEDTEATAEEATPKDLPPEAGEENAAVTGGYADGSAVYRPTHNWNVIYNHYDEVELLAADRLPGFTETLGGDKLEAVRPEKGYDWMDISAAAEFSYQDGGLCFVRMNVGTNLEEDIIVTLSPFENFGDCCVVVYPDADRSNIDGTEYQVFSHYWDDGRLYLWATMEKNGTYFRFEHTVPSEKEEQAKKDFEAVLECFTAYEDGRPDLSLIVPDEIPEYINEEMDHSEALKNEAFGAFVPAEGPQGFDETYFHYCKWGNVHSLTAHWYRGLDSFDVYISEFTDNDAKRVTSVTDTKNYDLNLYPIPRAESVPEELWEVVNDPVFEIDELSLEAVEKRTYYVEDAGDTDGPRMDFSVKYDDVLVRVIAKGVEPEWVYECLKDLK